MAPPEGRSARRWWRRSSPRLPSSPRARWRGAPRHCSCAPRAGRCLASTRRGRRSRRCRPGQGSSAPSASAAPLAARRPMRRDGTIAPRAASRTPSTATRPSHRTLAPTPAGAPVPPSATNHPSAADSGIATASARCPSGSGTPAWSSQPTGGPPIGFQARGELVVRLRAGAATAGPHDDLASEPRRLEQDLAHGDGLGRRLLVLVDVRRALDRRPADASGPPSNGGSRASRRSRRSPGPAPRPTASGRRRGRPRSRRSGGRSPGARQRGRRAAGRRRRRTPTRRRPTTPPVPVDSGRASILVLGPRLVAGRVRWSWDAVAADDRPRASSPRDAPCSQRAGAVTAALHRPHHRTAHDDASTGPLHRRHLVTLRLERRSGHRQSRYREPG